MFSDAGLQKTTGEWALLCLDTPTAKEMLYAQTAALVSNTVADKTVQDDTGRGIQAALLYVLLPWRWFRGGKSKSGNTSEDDCATSTESTSGAPTKPSS